MNDDTAKNLVKTTFENPYSKERFLTFAKNLFQFLESKTFIYRGKYIPDAYKDRVKTLERLGKYEDKNSNKIDILAVQLNKPASLDRARTLQRNFIAWYLNGSRGGVAKDGALVAFYTKDLANWRLSLVKMDYHLGKTKTGKVKAITELTPARRFSFLVGKEENTHTAQRRLLPILLNDQKPPTLSDFEEAFSVEVVTKDFFEKYKTLFLNTKEALDKIVAKDAKIKSDFTEKNIDTVDFTKKLLGQVVFLYFLQKKGWFGVARDEDWGTGPKDFLRRLFEKKLSDHNNFFNNILEPLFYEALAIERPDDFYSRFNCKIPFLDGGLFDPLNDYNWVHTDICLPDSLFSNSNKTKEDDIGDGILDVFDRYNFTVKEDEPLEKEVAVDPEMLGKVFENLLEVKDRKSKGTYYTPREIVHYMCQEILVNYLTTETDGKVKRDDIETLIRLGETAVEHDSRVVAHDEETETYKFKLPKSIRHNASLIDDSLEKIKVCDPAVGSGAFLVGMMTEVIRTRNTLSSYLPKKDRTTHAFKRHAVQNCLYGVDIDPGAVEIAKLRLWLSLIVDEQDIKQVKPLPNLDYKIMQGNSLLEEYEGIKLFDEGMVSTSPLDNAKQIEQVKEKLNELQREYLKLYSAGELKGGKKQQIEMELKRQNDLLYKLTKSQNVKPDNDSLFDLFSQAKQKADELKKLHQEFFEAAHKKDRDRLKKEVEALEWDLIETTLREQDKQSLLPEIERFKKANIKPFFLWKLNFSEVFEKNGGFDVVIANPPYIRQENIKPLKKQLEQYKVYTGTADILVYFYELGISLLHEGGFLAYITSNKFMRAGYGTKLRSFMMSKTVIKTIIDFGDLPVFEATAYPVIVIVEKIEASRPSVFKGIKIKTMDELQLLEKTVQDRSLEISQDEFKEETWTIGNKTNSQLISKVESSAVPLGKFVGNKFYRGITTGLNKAFVIDERGCQALIKEDPRSSEIIRPYLRGKDIKRYLINDQGIYIIYIRNGWTNKSCKDSNPEVFFKNSYPAVYRRVKPFQSKLEKRDDKGEYWWEMRPCRFLPDFEKKKIVYPDIARRCEFAFDQHRHFLGNTSYMIPTDNLFLLGILNSSIIEYWYRFKSAQIRGGFLRFIATYMVSLPIVHATEDQQRSIGKDVRLILNLKAQNMDTTHIEQKIDQLVYKLYGLTPEEIRIVEGGDTNA